MSTVVARPAESAGAFDGVRRSLRTPKAWLTLVFLFELVAAGTATGWALVVPHLAWVVGGAVAADLIGSRVTGRGWRWPSSALLSGLIVALVLGVDTPWTASLSVGALASAYKYLIRTRRGHVFNPAGLALLVAIPVFGTGQSWWGAFADMPWPWIALLAAGGAVIVDRVNKWPMVLSFLGSYFGLFTLIGLANPAAVVEMFRAPFVHSALFLAFFMATDPPTSPGRDVDQVRIGWLMASVAVIAQLIGAGEAYLLLGLVAGNVALALQRWSVVGDRESAAGASPPADREPPTPATRHARPRAAGEYPSRR